MKLHEYILFGLIGLSASTAGAVCGIGGGVIIKPLLDAFGLLSVEAISFLSGCTVLAMACFSVLKSITGGDSSVDKTTGTPLAIGAAAGGVAGKVMFHMVASSFSDRDQVGSVQAVCLLLITMGTLLYTVKKDRIKTHHITNKVVCIVIGFVLGILSSFLGIGGGPINLVVLFYFFSMDTKTAGQNSLYIILFSQAASLINSIAASQIPEFSFLILGVMVLSGIAGGAIGRKVCKRLSEVTVNKLFIVLMAEIMMICCYNIYQLS